MSRLQGGERRRRVLQDIELRTLEYKVNVMTEKTTEATTEDTLRAKSNVAFWMSVGIMLAPLVPYALGGTGA